MEQQSRVLDLNNPEDAAMWEQLKEQGVHTYDASQEQ